MADLTCRVIEIIRGTTHDGPGMRTTVFLKGCPLTCEWCQNPEGIKTGQEIWWDEQKCIRCLSCLEICPTCAVIENENGLHRDRSLCTFCGQCVEECPAKAMAFTSQEWALDDLVKQVLKDKDYFDAFGGGVTVSGGEPLSQSKFVAQFFKQLHERGIHTALDTCGLGAGEALRSVLPYTDAVLFDIKIIDPGLHKRYTGQSNEIILTNLAVVAETIRQNDSSSISDDNQKRKLWIRTPLIPGATATEENIAAIGRYIQSNFSDVVERWELCAFNPACKTKYKRMGLNWVYEDIPLMGQTAIDCIKTAALSGGIPEEKLVVSGLIAREAVC